MTQERYTHSIIFRCTEAEFDMTQALAIADGVTVSCMLRHLVDHACAKIDALEGIED